MVEQTTDPELERLLTYLHAQRGFDFTGYKRPSLLRRIDKRMHEVGVDSFAAYIDHIDANPDEFASLFDTILINVTSLFRDPDAWTYLADEIIPRIAAPDRGPEVRIWSAACATGEEAYTLAILLAEHVGIHDFGERVKIYATDLDEGAIERARRGAFTAEQLDGVSEERRERFFEQDGDRFAFRRDLRRCLIFGRHDLVQDAPISHIDLLVCRNTLMYLNPETQRRVLARFHFALADGGFLFVGKAETLLSHGILFEPVNPKLRVFRKTPHSGLQERLLLTSPGHLEPTGGSAVHLGLREAAFDSAPVAQLVLDPSRRLTLVNAEARKLLGLSDTDVGRPLQDLEISYRPLDLRSLIDEAAKQEQEVVVRDVEQQLPDGGFRYFDVRVAPLAQPGGPLGISVAFQDVSEHHQLGQNLERSHQELETAYEELQSSNEELETTNEELHSTVEELETTNEELQATVEELQTTNEELQASNEEMETVNEELRVRTQQLNLVNSYMDAVFLTLDLGLIVVDGRFRVHIWNDRCLELWGLRDEEVIGQRLVDLDIGVDTSTLEAPLRTCLETQRRQDLDVDAIDRRGRSIRCRVTCASLATDGHRALGAVVLIEVLHG